MYKRQVLEGGGAKGAYHVGAYKALKELNIEIGGIAGTSIGAINGAMMVQGDYELLEKVWYSVNSYELFDIDEKAIMDLKNFNLHDVNSVSYTHLDVYKRQGYESVTVEDGIIYGNAPLVLTKENVNDFPF